MSEKEAFIQNLYMFSQSSQAEVYFKLLQAVTEKYKLDFSQKRCVLYTSESGNLELSLDIGKITILSIKRDKIGLHIFFLVSREIANKYQQNKNILDFFSIEYLSQKDRDNPEKPVLISFNLETFHINNYQDLLENWYKLVDDLVNKKSKSKRSHNGYFYEVLTDTQTIQHSLQYIEENINSENTKSYHERNIEVEAEEDVKYDFSPDDVNINIEQKSLDILINRMRYEEIDLNPDFQRSAELWSKKNMSRLIESIILDLPLPAFYFDADDKTKWIVVDGLQRLSSLQKFVVYADPNHSKYEERLKLTGLEILEEYNHKDYNELPGRVKRQISEFTVVWYLIKPGTPTNVKYSIFHRVNTGGLRLRPQEIRNALNQNGNAPQILKEMSEEKLFKDIVNVSKERMKDRELVLRFIAFQILEAEDYKHINPFLNKAMEELNKQEEVYEQLKPKFLQALELSSFLFGEHTFSKSILGGKSDFNSPLFDVWMYYLAKMNEDEANYLKHNKNKIVEDFKTLLSERREDKKDLYDSITTASTDTTRVKRRFSLIQKLLSKHITNFSYFWQKQEPNDTKTTHQEL